MHRKLILLDLSSDVLVLISEYAGVLALHELFKVGDRLLLAKLFESPYFTAYSNVTEFGVPTCWSEKAVKKFRRLKKLHLVSPTDASAVQKPSWSFFRKLPPTLEEIRVHSSAALERWYRTPSKFESPFNFTSQFPGLKSLTLSYPEPDKWDYEDEYAIEWTWASRHFPSFPDSLTTLNINIPVRGMWSHACKLSQLTSLSLRILEDDNFMGLSIFASLPLLNDLSLSGLVSWYLHEDEYSESYVNPHRNLKILKLEDLQFFYCRTLILNLAGFRTLMRHVAYLDTLWVPEFRLNIPEVGDVGAAKHLKSLHCRFEPLSQNTVTPLTWEALKLEELVLMPMHVTTLYFPEEFLVSLPTHLQVLRLKYLSLTMDDLDLLPRGLRELLFYSLESIRDWGSVIQRLPPNLTTLAITNQDVYDTLTFNDDYLPFFSPHLQFIHSSTWTLFKARDLSKSILKTGWTSLIHAAATCDLESMHYLLCNTPQENLCTWIPKLISSVETMVHPDSWCWLLSRGFFASPPRTNQIDSSVILDLIAAGQKSLLLENLAKVPDLVLPPSMLVHVCNDRYFELFKHSLIVSKAFEDSSKISRLILQALGDRQFSIADFLCFELKFNYIDMKGFMRCILNPVNNDEDNSMTSAVTWLWGKHLSIESMHVSGVQATPESLFECLMGIMEPRFSNMALLKLLSYLVKHLGVDPHTVLESDGRYTRLSHIVCPTVSFTPQSAWHLKAVRWMFKYGVKIVPTQIKINNQTVSTSIADIAYQCNNVGLLSLLAFKGYNFREKVGSYRTRLLDSMDVSTRIIVKELMKEAKAVANKRK